MDWSVDACRDVAAERLTHDRERWAHVGAVAATAERIVAVTGLPEVVVCAAWLHDVGYAPSVEDTGFHPLDGARLLHSMDAPAELVSLVAYHSGAEYEAEERDLTAELHAFARPEQANLDALTLADLTVGATGSPVSVEDRLADILDRYPSPHPVHRAVLRSGGYLSECASRAETRSAVSR
jgi:hypothetical protein